MKFIQLDFVMQGVWKGGVQDSGYGCVGYPEHFKPHIA